MKDDDDRKMRNAIVIPPLLLDDTFRRRGFFDNKHAIIKDAALENRKGMESFIATWSEEERVLFRSRLSAVGKNYANIAMYLEKKSVKDCVLYYYLSKKRENYKVLFPKRKRKVAKSYKPPIMPTAEELMMYQLVPQDASIQTQRNILTLQLAFMEFLFINNIYLLANAPLQENRCINCQLRIDPAMNPGRVLTRASYEMYGIDSKKQGADVKICTKCKDLVLKNRNSGRCMVKACASGRRKAKATKPMPAKWRQMDDRQRAFLLAHMGIPREILKCCGPCFKRIGKKLDLLFSGDLHEEMEKFEEEAQQVWQNDEVCLFCDSIVTRLLNLVSDLGTDWNMVSEQMDGRSADECRIQYETGRKDDDDDDDDDEGETEKGERPDDEVIMEEETQDIPEVIVPEVETEDTTFLTNELIVPPPPSSPTDTEIEADRTQSENPAVLPVQSPIAISSLSDGPSTIKGSITAGTPFRPPSVSIIEPSVNNVPVPVSTPVSQSLATMATVANSVASACNTPQPQQSSTQSVANVDPAMLLQIQIHQLLGGGDENRSRAVMEQLAAGLQQQQRQYQNCFENIFLYVTIMFFLQQLAQISQLLSQQPQMEQLLLPYSMCTEAELIRLSTTAAEPPHVRMLAEVMLQKKQRESTAAAQAMQIRQQHSQNLLVCSTTSKSVTAAQTPRATKVTTGTAKVYRRQQQLLQVQEQQRREQQQVKDKMDQLKNGENALVTYEKLLISLANRVKDINQTLNSLDLTPFQRNQLALEYQQTSAQYNNAQTNYVPLKQQVHQLRLSLTALGVLPNATGTSMSGVTIGCSSSALVTGGGTSLSAASTSTRQEEIRSSQLLLSPDEQRIREEIDKNDNEIADVEKNLRRYEEEERNYQKMKMNAEQMMTSAFRINSKDQDIKAKRELNTAQDNLRIVEHTRITFQKRLESLKERREAFVTQLRTLRDTSGVIVGGSSHPLSKGAVKEFHPHKTVVQQQQQSYQPVTSSAINAHQQLQLQFHHHQQQQQQQQKNLIGIRQPTTEAKQVNCFLSCSRRTNYKSSCSKCPSFFSHTQSGNEKEIRSISTVNLLITLDSIIKLLINTNCLGLETICLPTVQSAVRHPQRRPASPAVTAIGTQRSSVGSRSILGIPTPFSVTTTVGSPQSQMSPRLSVPTSPQVQYMNSLVFTPKECVKIQSEVPSATVAPQRSEVPSAVVQPITVSAVHSSNTTTIQGFQIPSTNGGQLPPPSTLPFTLSQSHVLSAAPTYEPLSPEDEAVGSPAPVPTRSEPSTATCGAQPSNSRMFSVLDFDWPVPSSVPSSSGPAHPVPEILRGAPEGSAAAAAKPAFEPLSDDED
uniref:SANT domain-containing protein n=1 Tax=Heterorhabditis bacteriophora TaxID=37862 RepID=A0A1I7XQ04_HETBA